MIKVTHAVVYHTTNDGDQGTELASSGLPLSDSAALILNERFYIKENIHFEGTSAQLCPKTDVSTKYIHSM